VVEIGSSPASDFNGKLVAEPCLCRMLANSNMVLRLMACIISDLFKLLC
jgi:hypothetical protein